MRIPGFYRLTIDERLGEVAREYGLSDEDAYALKSGGGFTVECADKMVENCVGVFGLPVGFGLNFLVNGREYTVPMVVEEPSVVAAVSNMARLVRAGGGFAADADPSIMIGQVQVLDVPDLAAAVRKIESSQLRILNLANAAHPTLQQRGGGAQGVEARAFTGEHPMLVVHLLIDCLDAMGANMINTMAEAVAPLIEELTGGRTNLRILSNLADRRLARASCRIPFTALGGKGFDGPEVAQSIVEAWAFAAVDPYRAATHNKGVMNGIDAVAIATGNDWRSIEAGAHAYAARDGRYTSLTRWWIEDGHLCGSIELPMAVGTVGGSTRVHATIKVLRKILGIEGARELAGVIAASGLAQNLGALRALATEGIQRGHMSLHARQVALEAGVPSHQINAIAARMVELGQIRVDVARQLVAEKAA